MLQMLMPREARRAIADMPLNCTWVYPFPVTTSAVDKANTLQARLPPKKARPRSHSPSIPCPKPGMKNEATPAQPRLYGSPGAGRYIEAV